ncbi:MAG: RluA family pseudouridine synthase [Hyphomicrobiaceae bacterium]|nr:RluA family pseudouridine synthase [Hyphomicrobiaceae bacterium]
MSGLAITGDWEDEDATVEAGAAVTTLTVEAEAPSERIDAYLARRLAEVQPEGTAPSRSQLKRLIETGQVRVDGAVIDDASRKVGPGRVIEVITPPPVEATPQPEPIPLVVVYEDEHLLVIDKPTGLVVHPGAGNWTGTLVNALLHHCGATLSGIGGVLRPGIVHRLDKDTTGLMVVAKSDRAHRGLSEQFADHGRTGPLERAYQAVVWGMPRQHTGTLESQIGRDPRARERQAVVKTGGKLAITHYEVLEHFGGDGDAALASLVACHLETGRTHQIRVHMAAMRHPLLGDADYGAGFNTKIPKLAARSPAAASALAALRRQALHAGLLAFEHPVGKKLMRFESELPADMAALVDALRAMK